MKQYVITDKEIQHLLDILDKDPSNNPMLYIPEGLTDEQRIKIFYERAHRFYNYHVHRWLEEIKR